MIEPALTRVPRVAAIHDLSCFGRCALTVIIPTLSVMGLQCIPVPTALFSTHTGGFQNMHFIDLSDSMEGIADHFETLPLSFDALYSGFLGSARQIGIVSDFIDRFRCGTGKQARVLVDPVMGDDGRLYSTYTEELQAGMRRLCEKADIITPNLTEACFLTGTPWQDTTEMTAYDAEVFAGELAHKMSAFGASQIVITGVPCDDSIGTYGLDATKATDRTFFYRVTRQPKSFPGTGDIFASVLLGALMRGDDLYTATRAAADFVGEVIAYSQNCGEPTRDGVLLEPLLWKLAKGV
jgi:pyridoxine kinase